MKKTLFATALVLGILASSSAFAVTASLGNLKVNVNTPKLTTTKTTKTTTKSTIDTTKMKAQINALNTKINSVSSTYQKSVNDMVTNLLPADELAKYKEKVAKLKSSAKSGAELNIDIAEDGTIALNNSLKSNADEIIKNLTSAKKAAVNKDLSALSSVKSSYLDIANKSKDLAAAIKKEPAAALALHSELFALTKNAAESAKQANNITKLTANVTSALAKAGIKAK